MDFHGNVDRLRPDYDSSIMSWRPPATSPTLALCEGHEREIAMLAKLGHAAADQAHALEDRAQHDGTPLRNF